MVEINFGRLNMSQDEADWLRCAAALNGDTAKATLTMAWRGHLCKHKPHYIKKLRYLAERHGLTIQETFKRLIEGTDLGEIKNEFPLDALEELTSNTFFNESPDNTGEQKS